MTRILRSTLLLQFFFVLSVFANSTGDKPLQYKVNLNDFKDGKLTIEITDVSGKNSDELVFCMPKIVPGTYKIYNFGRFVSGLQSWDAEGRPCDTEQTDENCFLIRCNDAPFLLLTYRVEETFRHEDKENFVFQPAGTAFEEDSAFLINPHAVFGYFPDRILQPILVEIEKPEYFAGISAMNLQEGLPGKEIYSAENYHKLADSPLLFSRPDTAVIYLDETEILIASYANYGGSRAAELADILKVIMEATHSFLGGKLPVNKYAFIFYFDKDVSYGGGYGALEHMQSSVYYLPKMVEQDMAGTVSPIAAHEFYHIITPLNIHSEHIANFDYNNPVMSRHLWLYEGVTEYMATYIPLHENLKTLPEFIEELKRKISWSKRFNDSLPFTELSLKALDKHKDQYQNVYLKGALIGFCLDVYLRHYSRGDFGLQEVMTRLSDKYGPNRNFRDEALFEEITEMTFSEIGVFFRNYVEGTQRLPLKEAFAMLGFEFEENQVVSQLTLGNVQFGVNMEGHYIYVENTDNLNDFGKKMGYRTGDILRSINNKEVTLATMESLLKNLRRTLKPGDPISVVVERPGKKGKSKMVTLNGKATYAEMVADLTISPDMEIWEGVAPVRKAWLGKGGEE